MTRKRSSEKKNATAPASRTNEQCVSDLSALCMATDPSLPFSKVFVGDARDLSKVKPHGGDEASVCSIPDRCIDLILTSPPYWNKRDYEVTGQIGQESTAGAYVEAIVGALGNWRRVLRSTGSVFLNIGDTYADKSLQGIPSLVESAARNAGWAVRNRIIWVKKWGMPDPAKDRLASRHEYILHFALNGYYYDLFGYAQEYSADKRGANPGDVWELSAEREMGDHLAPFPTELVKRAIALACPAQVCSKCGSPRVRITEATSELDSSRTQAVRAMELAKIHKLTEAHFAAIRATGISDTGKAKKTQTGTDRNTDEVKRLAKQAKDALGGYFREFTFGKRQSVGWTDCGCKATFIPGVVLDPFAGTGTTLSVAQSLGRSAIGVDLDPRQLTHIA
jgi:DNA modification methylase